MSRLMLLLIVVACTGKGDDTDKNTSFDDSGDSDTDTDADSDTDTETYPTYADFVAAHAETYCNSLDACGLLDDQGYDSVDACVKHMTSLLERDDCAEYDVQTAGVCVSQDADIENRCSDSSGTQPPSCRRVCGGPDKKTR